MTYKKILFNFIWLAPVTFLVFMLVSYRNDLDNDGCLSYGFPKTIYQKCYGLSTITQQIGVSDSFYWDDLFWDIVFAMIVAIVLSTLYVFIKKKAASRNKGF